MASGRKRPFEFKVGTIGITILTVGVSVLVLASFMFGVLVGRNIESYPEKIAKGIPSAIKEKITKYDETTPGDQKRTDIPLTFYRTLSQRGEELPHSLPADISQKEEKPKETEELQKESLHRKKVVEQPRVAGGTYTIQVAAFRDRASVERLRLRLETMKYITVIHETSSSDQGTWYRLRIGGFNTREDAQREVKKIENAVKGLKCLILRT